MAARPHRRRSRALASVAASLALLAPACGSDDTAASPDGDATAATPAPAATAATAASTAPAADEPAPANSDTGAAATDTPAAAPIELLSFDATLVGGGTFDGAAYATERPVAFWFWAPT